MVDPVSIKDHHGQGIILTQGSPARLRKLVHRAIEDMLELQFMDKLIKEGTGTDQEFAGARFKGLNFKPVRRALAAKEVEPGAKLGLRKAFTDGVVTAGKLARMGYKISSRCRAAPYANRLTIQYSTGVGVPKKAWQGDCPARCRQSGPGSWGKIMVV